MRSALFALPLLTAAAACGGPQTPAPTDAGPVSPLVHAALAEWEAWGRVVVVGWPETRPADTAATPARFTRLLEYWTAVPGGAAVAQRLWDQRSAIAATLHEQGGAAARDGGGDPPPGMAAAAPGPEDIALYAFPAWSAAFVAAVARRAGLPEGDLPSAATHVRYIDAVLARALAAPEGTSFRPHAPEERAPRPGDLLCADRSASPLTHWSERLAEAGRFRPMHCDVVVRSGAGEVEVVGGNVQELVVLRRLPAGADGRVLPAPPGQPVLMLILAARRPR